MSSADQPWYTLLRLPMDDSAFALCSPLTMDAIQTPNSSDVLVTSDNTSSVYVDFQNCGAKLSNPPIDTTAKNETENVRIHHTSNFVEEEGKSTSEEFRNENMEQPINEIVNGIESGGIIATTSSKQGLVGLTPEENNESTTSIIQDIFNSKGRYNNNTNNNRSEVGDNMKLTHDGIKPDVPIADISVSNICASTSSIPHSSVPQILKELDLTGSTVPEIAESTLRPFNWLDVKDQEPSMKPVICYPFSSSAGNKVDLITAFPYQEINSEMKDQVISQVLPFSKSRTDLRTFPFQELNTNNTELLFASLSKHKNDSGYNNVYNNYNNYNHNNSGNINNNNNNNNNNNKNSNNNNNNNNSDAYDNSKAGENSQQGLENGECFCPDIQQPHAVFAAHTTQECAQTEQVQRACVEQLQSTKEQYKQECIRRDLLAYENEEAAHAQTRYYARDNANTLPYMQEQTNIGEHQFLVEHAQESGEHVYTEHHTQEQYFHFEEQNYFCSSRVIPLFIKEEQGEEGRGEGGGGPGDADRRGREEEIGAGGGGGWLTDEDCRENYWAFSPRYVNTTTPIWQQESGVPGDIWQFPGPSHMAVTQPSSSPQLPSREDEFSPGVKRQEAKKCGVCGDRALGYNFNAITCESCKAFFRRNALKNKEFRCPFQDQCRVDQVTRRFCQKCRLRKCLDIGMKKEWIMTEEEKRRKKQKIEENRARKICVGQDDEDVEKSRINVNGDNDSSNNNSNNNNNNVRVITTMMPSASASSSSASFSSPSSSSTLKPQAVVVGVIREEETQPTKVQRLEGEVDVHHHRDSSQVDVASTQPNLRECEYVEYTPLGRGRKLGIKEQERGGAPIPTWWMPST